MTKREAQRKQVGIEKREAIRRHLSLPQEPGWRERKKRNELSRRLMILMLAMIFVLSLQKNPNDLLGQVPLDQIQSIALNRTVHSAELAQGVSLIYLQEQRYLIFVPEEGQEFSQISTKKTETNKNKQLTITAKRSTTAALSQRKLYRLPDAMGIEQIHLIIDDKAKEFAAVYTLEEEEELPQITSETLKRLEEDGEFS